MPTELNVKLVSEDVCMTDGSTHTNKDRFRQKNNNNLQKSQFQPVTKHEIHR